VISTGNRAGHLNGILGIAIGQFTRCNTADGWTVVDVLRDRLSALGVPVLGGLPLGHGPNAIAFPVGTEAVLDADRRTLTAVSAVR
jgi:muramoyltetrapeptide carboxypeptidase